MRLKPMKEIFLFTMNASKALNKTLEMFGHIKMWFSQNVTGQSSFVWTFVDILKALRLNDITKFVL